MLIVEVFASIHGVCGLRVHLLATDPTQLKKIRPKNGGLVVIGEVEKAPVGSTEQALLPSESAAEISE
jgi:hypothetical protein